MKKTKSKLTNKQIVNIVGGMANQLEQLKHLVYINEKALDEYIKFKNDRDTFINFLKEKQEKIDDTARKEAKEE